VRSISAILVLVKRVAVLGPGASGKSTLALRLGELTGLPIIELDNIFWQPGLAAMPRGQWITVQQNLIEKDAWIMDGDLGPYDAVEVRLRTADTIIFLDFSVLRCAWRALRRSHERIDFWLWLVSYKYRSRPFLMKMIAAHASGARLYVLQNPGAVARFLRDLERNVCG
jgi:adenylate kinase family enzyme